MVKRLHMEASLLAHWLLLVPLANTGKRQLKHKHENYESKDKSLSQSAPNETGSSPLEVYKEYDDDVAGSKQCLGWSRRCKGGNNVVSEYDGKR